MQGLTNWGSGTKCSVRRRLYRVRSKAKQLRQEVGIEVLDLVT